MTHAEQATTDDVATTTEDGALAGTRLTRLGISVFVLLVLAGIAVSTMPASVIKGDLLPVATPYLRATGLDQQWGMYAPNPNTEARVNIARIDHVDGTSSFVSPADGVGLSNYWDYRWRTYVAQLGGPGRPGDFAAYAGWIVDRDRQAGGRPTRVTLFGHGSTLAPPGPGPDHGPVQNIPFFSMPVSP